MIGKLAVGCSGDGPGTTWRPNPADSTDNLYGQVQPTQSDQIDTSEATSKHVRPIWWVFVSLSRVPYRCVQPVPLRRASSSYRFAQPVRLPLHRFIAGRAYATSLAGIVPLRVVDRERDQLFLFGLDPDPVETVEDEDGQHGGAYSMPSPPGVRDRRPTDAGSPRSGRGCRR